MLYVLEFGFVVCIIVFIIMICSLYYNFYYYDIIVGWCVEILEGVCRIKRIVLDYYYGVWNS